MCVCLGSCAFDRDTGLCEWSPKAPSDALTLRHDIISRLKPRAIAKDVVQFTDVAFVKDMTLFGKDPSAGSPTETLLRLLLPLGDKVH